MQMMESLEGRRLLTTVNVTQIITDNRGEVSLRLSGDVIGVSKRSVKVYTSGTDGEFDTADDVRVPSSVNYSSATDLIRIRAQSGVNTNYRIRVEAKQVKSADDGSGLDGEYTSGTSTGNGQSGGNLNVRTRRDTSATPRARMRTSEGNIDLVLQRTLAPDSVANFLNYANSRRYDNVFFTRSVPGFVIQGGSLQITGDGQDAGDIVKTETDAPIAGENDNPGALSNTRGTMSFATAGPNSATNQFFLNLGDNSALDSPSRPDGGFTVFAVVSGDTSLANMDAIAAKPVAALQNQAAATPAGVLQDADTSGTGLTDVPVNDLDAVSGVENANVGADGTRELVQGDFQPADDLVVIYRVALRTKLATV